MSRNMLIAMAVVCASIQAASPLKTLYFLRNNLSDTNGATTGYNTYPGLTYGSEVVIGSYTNYSKMYIGNGKAVLNATAKIDGLTFAVVRMNIIVSRGATDNTFTGAYNSTRISNAWNTTTVSTAFDRVIEVLSNDIIKVELRVVQFEPPSTTLYIGAGTNRPSNVSLTLPVWTNATHAQWAYLCETASNLVGGVGSTLYATNAGYAATSGLSNWVLMQVTGALNSVAILDTNTYNRAMLNGSNLFVHRADDSFTGVFHQVLKLSVRNTNTITILDNTANGNNAGVNIGGLSSTTSANTGLGNAILCDSIGYGTVPYKVALLPTGNAQRSVSFWAFFVTTGISGIRGMYSWGNSGSTANDFWMTATMSASKISTEIGDVTIAGSQWYHIVVTFAATNANWGHEYIYTNGALAKFGSAQYDTADTRFDFLNKPSDSTGPMGNLSKIDEFAIWNVALNTNQITNLWHSGAGRVLQGTEDNLVLLYRFTDLGAFVERYIPFQVMGNAHISGTVSADGTIANSNNLTTKAYVDAATNACYGFSNVFDTVASVDNKTNTIDIKLSDTAYGLSNNTLVGSGASRSISTSVVFGKDAYATGVNTVAVGNNAKANGANANVTGYNAWSMQNRAVVQGSLSSGMLNAVVCGVSSFAISNAVTIGYLLINNYPHTTMITTGMPVEANHATHKGYVDGCTNDILAGGFYSALTNKLKLDGIW